MNSCPLSRCSLTSLKNRCNRSALSVTRSKSQVFRDLFDWSQYADGVFGVGTATMHIFNNGLFEGLKINSYGFLLDGGDPHIDLNQFNGAPLPLLSFQETFDESIIWSDRMSTQSRILSTTYLSIYGFSLCGISLLGRFSSAYPATISPASKCLAVPMQVFNNIYGWIPLKCPKDNKDKHKLCSLSSVGAVMRGNGAGVGGRCVSDAGVLDRWEQSGDSYLAREAGDFQGGKRLVGQKERTHA